MAAYLVMISVLFVGINLVVDLLYYAVDPRLRTELQAPIDYGQRYRAGKPISTSRAEGTAHQLWVPA